MDCLQAEPQRQRFPTACEYSELKDEKKIFYIRGSNYLTNCIGPCRQAKYTSQKPGLHEVFQCEGDRRRAFIRNLQKITNWQSWMQKEAHIKNIKIYCYTGRFNGVVTLCQKFSQIRVAFLLETKFFFRSLALSLKVHAFPRGKEKGWLLKKLKSASFRT